jgi:hypothetical protein
MGALKFSVGPLDSLRENLGRVLTIELPTSAKSFVSVTGVPRRVSNPLREECARTGVWTDYGKSRSSTTIVSINILYQ